MPGIVVGVDGSGHSQRALEWAMKEASLRNAPVTVLAVHPTARGFFSDNSSFPQDKTLTDQVREAAQAEIDKLVSQIGDAGKVSVTVKAVNGIPVEELVNASRDADGIASDGGQRTGELDVDGERWCSKLSREASDVERRAL